MRTFSDHFRRAHDIRRTIADVDDRRCRLELAGGRPLWLMGVRLWRLPGMLTTVAGIGRVVSEAEAFAWLEGGEPDAKTVAKWGRLPGLLRDGIVKALGTLAGGKS